MKKSKMIICLAIVIITLFASMTIAGASESSPATWNSGTCYNLFTTSNATYKSSGNWSCFTVVAEMDFTPFELQQLLVIPKSTSGLIMGSWTTVQYSNLTEVGCYSYSSSSGVKMVVKNPYGPSGPNMESEGCWWGDYS